MSDSTIHDPGMLIAAGRAPDESHSAPLRLDGAEIRIGTAGWTDRTLTARGVFYPDGVSTPEARLRYYASRLSMVEADAGFYAIQSPETAARWAERAPAAFVFNVKAHALMTGHATDVARLPRLIRDELPPALASAERLYAKDLPSELRDVVWRLFRDSVEPLHDAGKLGAILLQLAPWIRPARHTPQMFSSIRQRLGDLPVAIEFRHPSWLEPRLRERAWAQLDEYGFTYVVADTPPGTPTSMPIVPAITTPELGIVRLHGRRSELWGARNATVSEKYRYLYDRDELEEWRSIIMELAEQAERVHIVFNNCYANYGTTNALEMAELLVSAG
ncbi:MAG TPA: DUF72 domain-containing protein [Gemmatimonadaceae bacterium]|nr:DUF72 domain-containing protein [Gemmatimonadaceae bacterium]